MYYEIREKWNMVDKEYYFNIRQNLRQVEHYIKEWIEGWRDNCEDMEYKWKGLETDYKTYAICRIKREDHIDIFRIKVIKKKGKMENRTALNIYSWDEEVAETQTLRNKKVARSTS